MDDDKSKAKLTMPQAGIGLGISGTFSWAMLEPETFKAFMSAAWKENVTQWLVALFIAGVMHRFIFRKDIEKTVVKIVQPLVDALNKVADANEQTGKQLISMHETMNAHGDVLTKQGKRLDLIEQHLTPRHNES